MTAPITQDQTTDQKSTFLSNLAKPHASVTDPTERRRVRFLATILLVLAGLTSMNIPTRLISGSAFEEPVIFAVFVIFCTALFAEYGLCRTRYYRYAPGLAIATLTAIIYGVFFIGGATSSSTLLWLVSILIFASTILSLRDTLFYAIGNIVFIAVCIFLIPSVSLETTTSGLFLFFVSSFLILVQMQYRNIIEEVRQQELTATNAELNVLSQSLEVRVQERTQDLALAGEVGRAVSQIRDINELLTEAVILIRERFNLYYTQIYLVDELQETLVIRAGTGQVGKTLLSQQHTLFIDESSINGRAAALKEAVIVADTQNSDFFRPNPSLPDTRSEMSIPLIVQDKVVGVIDLQSNRANALSQDNLPAFKVLAGQLAVAIANANLLTEMEETTLFLDSIVANIPSILFVKEAKELRYVRVSRGMEELVGMSAAEIEGKNHYDFFPPETAESFAAQDYEVLNGAELVNVPEEVVEGVNGSVILHTLKAPVMGSDGKPKYLIGISRDITNRKQMERDLQGRVKQLNLLNDIGRQVNQVESVPELLQWVCSRVPQALRFPDECLVAISLDGTLHGNPKAKELPRHIIEDLQVNGETVGHIYIAYTNMSHDFVDEESALIGGIGRRVSSYLETHRLLEQLQTQATDLRKVAEISTAVAAIQNPFELLQKAATLTREQFNFSQTSIFRYNRDANELALVAGSGQVNQENISQIPPTPFNSQKSTLAKAARSKEFVLVNNALLQPDYLPQPLLSNTRSELVIPLQAGEELLGVLDFHSVEPNDFSEEAINIYSTLALQITISWQNAIQHEQTQAALEELSSLQRVITNESWESFMTNMDRSVQGYIAAQYEVQPIAGDTEKENEDDNTDEALVKTLDATAAYILPVQVRGTTIGKLGVRSNTNEPLSEENQELIATISQQVAEALERARLFEETELARAQTDQLFAGSERVVRSTSVDEVLSALVDHTKLQRLDRVNLLFFDEPWLENQPKSMMVTAVWEADGEEPRAPIGTVYQMDEFPVTKMLSKNEPFVVNDIRSDSRVDEATRTLFSQHLGMNSVAVFPLVAGEQWIGIITAQAAKPQNFNSADLRQISSLVDQAATVAQTQRLFEEANSRAQQEQILRQVSERVYGAVDAESVLRTAVKEVGQALGLEAFIYLDENTHGTPATNGTTNKNKATNDN